MEEKKTNIYPNWNLDFVIGKYANICLYFPIWGKGRRKTGIENWFVFVYFFWFFYFILSSREFLMYIYFEMKFEFAKNNKLGILEHSLFFPRLMEMWKFKGWELVSTKHQLFYFPGGLFPLSRQCPIRGQAINRIPAYIRMTLIIRLPCGASIVGDNSNWMLERERF